MTARMQGWRPAALKQARAPLRMALCLFGRGQKPCTGRQMRNGLILANMIVWILIITVVTLLA